MCSDFSIKVFNFYIFIYDNSSKKTKYWMGYVINDPMIQLLVLGSIAAGYNMNKTKCKIYNSGISEFFWGYLEERLIIRMNVILTLHLIHWMVSMVMIWFSFYQTNKIGWMKKYPDRYIELSWKSNSFLQE